MMGIPLPAAQKPAAQFIQTRSRSPRWQLRLRRGMKQKIIYRGWKRKLSQACARPWFDVAEGKSPFTYLLCGTYLAVMAGGETQHVGSRDRRDFPMRKPCCLNLLLQGISRAQSTFCTSCECNVFKMKSLDYSTQGTFHRYHAFPRG